MPSETKEKKAETKVAKSAPKSILPEKPKLIAGKADVTFAHDVKTLLEWQAPGRPYKTRSNEFYINALLIMTAVEILVYLIFKDFALMTVIFSLVFLTFALAKVPPHPLFFKISSEGIRVEDHFYIWEELYDFYFMKSHGQEVLHVRTKAYFPGELIITLGTIQVNEIKSVLLPFLPFREYVKPTLVQRAGDWLERTFPLEKSSI